MKAYPIETKPVTKLVLALLVAGFDFNPAVLGDGPGAYAAYAARLDDNHPFWWRNARDDMAPGLAEQARMRAEPPADLGPVLFAPYHDQIELCECGICHAIACELSSHYHRFYGHDQHREVCAALLAQLRAGTHEHMTLAERAQIARAGKAQRLAQAQANGASAETLAAIERGYVAVRMSDFYTTGMGLGIGPHPKAHG